MLHLYWGDGKGKTTAAMGLALRALGHGRRVVILQFLKDGSSGEIEMLRRCGAVVYACPNAKFTWLMTDAERAEARRTNTRTLQTILQGSFDLLVLDEPVDGLDPVMRRQVWSLILQDVAERGTTVLVSSHNLRELEDVCDHVGVMSRGKLLLEHSLSELQDYTVKLQLAFEGAELPALPQEIKVLHHAQTGRVHTLICRGSAEDLEQQLAALHPIFIDAVPLSLEEIFIYELGGEDYAIRDIVL